MAWRVPREGGLKSRREGSKAQLGPCEQTAGKGLGHEGDPNEPGQESLLSTTGEHGLSPLSSLGGAVNRPEPFPGPARCWLPASQSDRGFGDRDRVRGLKTDGAHGLGELSTPIPGVLLSLFFIHLRV